MKVAIIGSRNITKIAHEYIINRIPRNCSEIISGGATGIDSIAQNISKEINVLYTAFLPDYEKHGKSAPLLRNEKIVKSANLVLAFWDGTSKGTAHALSICINNHIPFRIYLPNHISE